MLLLISFEITFCYKIDEIATCFAQFSDGNMNYIISRSLNKQKFICFVSQINFIDCLFIL